MKKIFYFTLALATFSVSAQVGIGVPTANINASAQLEVASTNKGFLPPRMTITQRDAISAPAAGLILWCTNCGSNGELQVYNGTQWTNIVGATASGILQTPIVTPIVDTYTYSGSPKGPNSATNTGIGTSYTYSYAGTGSTSYGPSATAPSAIGTYIVTVTVAANGNFGQASSAATAFSIYGTVTTATGRIWMDRNLGASRVALSSTDTQAYGDYYQWGRPADGHQTQYLNNGFTYTKSSTSVPSNSLFILPQDSSDDWISAPDNTLWTGANPANNPCPFGFRIPTEAEWASEQATWSSNNSAGAFASPLKLPVPGWISTWHSNAFFTAKDAFGVYPTQTAYSNGQVKYLGIEPNNSWFDTNIFKYMGMPCRCIKD